MLHCMVQEKTKSFIPQYHHVIVFTWWYQPIKNFEWALYFSMDLVTFVTSSFFISIESLSFSLDQFWFQPVPQNKNIYINKLYVKYIFLFPKTSSYISLWLRIFRNFNFSKYLLATDLSYEWWALSNTLTNNKDNVNPLF